MGHWEAETIHVDGHEVEFTQKYFNYVTKNYPKFEITFNTHPEISCWQTGCLNQCYGEEQEVIVLFFWPKVG